MACISIDGLGFRYPDAPADTLTDLTLRVEDGEAHGLLGASGAGKSTMLALLSGLLEPTRGEISFDGKDVTRTPARARNVAQVFQFPVLYDGMSVLRNLTFPLTQRGWKKSDATARAREVARSLDIESLLAEGVQKLSLFQRQLVSVGRAIVRPDVALVLLDEPLTAVQPATKTRLRQVLKAVQRDMNLTMIYVTHDQTEALTFASAVSVMADGRLLQTDTAEMLYNEPAHETVAHFIGDPGMNIVDARVQGGRLHLGDWDAGALSAPDGPVRLAFRAEWIDLGQPGGLPMRVLHRRDRGTRNGEPVGIAELSTEGIRVRARYHGTLEQNVIVGLQRYVAFREGKRVG